MIIVIIAGGTGSRLWPLSTNNYPKQLLNLTSDRSMVQNTYDRARHLSNNIYVLPDISHSSLIKEQLPELTDDNFIIEPGRRGTLNCTLAALSHVSKRHSSNEPIAFMYTDHHIRDIDSFVNSFELAAKASLQNKKITLIGIDPSYPATGFGYIERSSQVKGLRDVFKVDSFKEKPDFITARDYMISGRYLWNCGYFVGSLDVFLTVMSKYTPKLLKNYNDLNSIKNTSSVEYKEKYLKLKNDSIDYALLEKTKDLQVVPASFDWIDLGSFKDLHTANLTDEFGNYISGDGIETLDIANSYIRNDEGKPLAVIGLDNVVVVNSKNGILVARKDLSQKVGDIAKKIQKK